MKIRIVATPNGRWFAAVTTYKCQHRATVSPPPPPPHTHTHWDRGQSTRHTTTPQRPACLGNQWRAARCPYWAADSLHTAFRHYKTHVLSVQTVAAPPSLVLGTVLPPPTPHNPPPPPLLTGWRQTAAVVTTVETISVKIMQSLKLTKTETRGGGGGGGGLQRFQFLASVVWLTGWSSVNSSLNTAGTSHKLQRVVREKACGNYGKGKNST